MFERLVLYKEKVKITCGVDTIIGTISQYHNSFQLIKIENVLIPIECIREIEVLDRPLALPELAIGTEKRSRP